MNITYTHKTARNLINVRDVREMLRMSNYIENNDAFCLFIKKELKRFKLLKHGASAKVFVNKADNVVVKVNGVFNAGDVPKRAIPTAISYNEDFDRLIRIQPIADVSKEVIDKAMKVLEKLRYKDIGDDFHQGNVGKYKGKFVVIDW